ncbi:MAG TPA: hypothetical protein EYP23_00655 [Thermoplasmata archaeon]|nr:hypothetical protein [Thermoplasmata archaeon]
MRMLITIGVVTLFFVELCCVMPTGTALVWITPMKMMATGNISSDLGVASVEKTIILRNDGNKSVFISLNASGINVVFEENSFELQPNEKKTIHPVVLVEEGRRDGVINVVVYEKEEKVEGIGSKVVTSMSISVVTVGERLNSSPGSDLPGPGAGFFLLITAAAAVGFLILRGRFK